MELENYERIVVNPEQCKELFNTVLEKNANGNSTFNENDTNFSQHIDTSTVSIKEETPESIFVGEDSFLETKIKIEEHDLYHNATHLFDKTKYYCNKDNIEKDLDIRSKCVNSAKEFENFSCDGLKQSIQIDSTSISLVDSKGINWKVDVENSINFVNHNENHVLSKVSPINDNESNWSEILSEEKTVQLKRSIERQLKESVKAPLNNNKISNLKGNVVERWTHKNTSAELLKTTEELYVYLQQQDLHELQRTFRRNQSENKDSENGVQPQCSNADQPNMFSCRLSHFKSDTKYQHAVHIIENHKEVVKARNMVEAKCMMPDNSRDEILFKCNECSYITNILASFKHHLLSHKSVDELERSFRCASCPFVAKSKSRIIMHMLGHIPPEKQNFHKCPHCDFQAKQKQYIKNHIQRMHIPEKKGEGRYKCTQCPYQTNSLYIFKKFHSLKHTSDEGKVHVCPLCSYKGKTKEFLKNHMLIHKMPDKVIMYKCNLCPFSTKAKDNLTQHQKIHLGMSEEDSLCSIKTKVPGNLKMHSIIHENPEDLEMFKCVQCSFSTKHKQHIKKHMMTHTKSYYNCPLCSFKTNNISCLYNHKKNDH